MNQFAYFIFLILENQNQQTTTNMSLLRNAAVHHLKRVIVSRQRFASTLIRNKSEIVSAIRNNVSVRRTLSSSSAVTGNQGVKAAGTKKEVSDYFLDNLGGIFLCTIGAIFLSLIRSSYGTTNKNNIRDDIEQKASLDPMEIDDLRVANSELDPTIFRQIMQELIQDFPIGRATYQDFVKSVRNTMATLKGPAFTIELGHLIDRAVISAFAEQGKSQEEDMPLSFWLTILSMALHSSSNDRIRILYEAMEINDTAVTYVHTQEIIGYLQVSSQLVPDSQVVMSDQKYPTQQYHRGTPSELIKWSGNDNDPVDIEAFAEILRSNAVCAWGECYLRKKPTIQTTVENEAT